MAERAPAVLLARLVFPEGPRWHEGRLWFSDIQGPKVYAVDLKGRSEVIAEVPARPSGLGFLPDGRLLIVSMQDRLLLRLDPDGPRTVANLTDFTRGDCNDMVVDAQGRAYIGNFGFDFEKREEPTPTGLVMVQPDGAARVVAEGLLFPNGVVITADGGTLMVAESFGRKLTAFDIAEDGSLSNQRTWADIAPAVPDGICLDAEGAVWVGAVTSSEFLRVAEGGEILDRIDMGGRMSIACMLGGPERRTLFLCTAAGSEEERRQGKTKGFIETVEVDIPGAGWP